MIWYCFFRYSTTPTDDTQDDLNEMAGDESDDELDDDEDDGINLSGVTNMQPLWVLPLYSLLSSQEQAKVRLFLFKIENSLIQLFIDN